MVQLFDGVVEKTGLAAMIAPGAVRRALAEIDRDPDTATPRDYRKALASLRRRMEVYMTSAEVEVRVRAIEAFLD